jgi:SAM-dependent methyltransferase
MQSFEYQWRNLPVGPHLLSDPRFRRDVPSYICAEFGKPEEWFKGKLVLDAGCGGGRWSYGFEELGCRVVAFDTSSSGCRSTLECVQSIDVICADIFHVPLRDGIFDIVFSWGVLHHTGNIPRAFESIARKTKHGGLMHIYVYGKWNRKFVFWNRLISALPLRQRHTVVKVLTAMVSSIPTFGRLVPFGRSEHANFDAFSPNINDQSSFEDAKAWFEQGGFTQVERRYCAWGASDDIFMQGAKT